MKVRHLNRLCQTLVSVGLMGVTGCAVGPNYKRPTVDSPAAFRGDDATNSSPVGLAWWQVYQDPNLQGLIREAISDNYDLLIAATRVQQARAVAMQTRAQFIPIATYGGAVSRGRNDEFGSAFPDAGATVNSATGSSPTFVRARRR